MTAALPYILASLGALAALASLARDLARLPAIVATLACQLAALEN